jgi:hypothetical protein
VGHVFVANHVKATQDQIVIVLDDTEARAEPPSGTDWQKAGITGATITSARAAAEGPC